MPVIRHTETRRTETPNAVMTTFASPTLGETRTSVWRVEMNAGQRGPLHQFDAEQIWTWQQGSATVLLDGEPVELGAGDTIVIPAGVPRQISTDAGFAALVAAPAEGRVRVESSADPILPEWIA
jgi:quercetin dioxygenase-like cupin family protein